MEVATDILDLKLKFDKESKQISAHMSARDTDSFTYFCLVRILSSFVNIENIPKGVALCLRRICDSDEKFEKHSAEYQNYLIARDYKAGRVKKFFSDIKNLTREEARKPKLLKTTFFTSCNLITQYNPLLHNLKTIIRKYLPVLYSNQQILDIFPHNTISVTYKKNVNLREILSPSLFPRTTN